MVKSTKTKTKKATTKKPATKKVKEEVVENVAEVQEVIEDEKEEIIEEEQATIVSEDAAEVNVSEQPKKTNRPARQNFCWNGVEMEF